MDQIEGLTYQTIDTALQQLGFQRRETDKARLRDLSQAPLRSHLSAAAATLEMFEIQDQYDFSLLLLRLAPLKVAA